ncbi:alanine aminotransferase 1-like, partial [Brachionus plicatilis]
MLCNSLVSKNGVRLLSSAPKRIYLPIASLAQTTNNNLKSSKPNLKISENDTKAQKCLTMETLSSTVKNVQYAVRGRVVIRAGELEKELQNGVSKPFDRVIRANIGDCHATGQKPITFLRQVMAICSYPDLLKSDEFPEDVKQRAKELLNACGGGSVGAYTDSTGLEIVRKHIADFITERDGFTCDSDDIYLTTGASGGIKIMMEMLLNGQNEIPAGFMIPIPQYPLYSATISEYNAEQIGYYLD